MGDANLWATEGGIIGLVLLALFSIIFTFIHFMKKLLTQGAEERESTSIRHIEHVDKITERGERSSERLSASIDSLAQSINQGDKTPSA